MEIRGGRSRTRPIRDQVLHRALLFDGSNGSEGKMKLLLSPFGEEV